MNKAIGNANVNKIHTPLFLIRLFLLHEIKLKNLSVLKVTETIQEYREIHLIAGYRSRMHKMILRLLRCNINIG